MVDNYKIVSWVPREAFHSAGDEDKFLVDYFKKRNGFLIDIGAADGVTGSLSYKLINAMGWGGILIEPIPKNNNQLRELYSNNKKIKISRKAISSSKAEVNFTLVDDENIGLSHIKNLSDHPQLLNSNSELIKVQGDTIENILNENNCPEEIDFVKIDVEGSESFVLDNWDFTKFKVNIFCIENGKKYLDFFKKNSYQMLTPKAEKYFSYHYKESHSTKKFWNNFKNIEVPSYDFVHGNVFFINRKYINNFIKQKFIIGNSK